MHKHSARHILEHAQLKYSKQREQLIDTLSSVNIPMTIEQLEEAVRNSGVSMNLSTLYRILDAFEKHDIIEKTYSTNQTSYFYELKKHEHRHYMVCLKCKNIIPIESCPMDQIIRQIEKDTHFHVTHHQLELSGYCQQCQS